MEKIVYNQLHRLLLNLEEGNNLKNLCGISDDIIDLKKAIYNEFLAGRISEEMLNELIEQLEHKSINLRRKSIRSRIYPKIKRSRCNLKRCKALAFGVYSKLADKITPAIKAVMRVIEVESIKHGVCTLSIKEIGDIAGIARSTVQYALRFLRSSKLVSIDERRIKRAPNLTNVISIAEDAWIELVNSETIQLELKSGLFGLKKHEGGGLKKMGCLLNLKYITSSYYREMMKVVPILRIPGSRIN